VSDIDDHRHCKVCGKVSWKGEETCSTVCRDRNAQRVQSRQNSVRLMYVLIFGAAVLLAIELFH
jgi:predicted nucleic acid-binding Zn ribbon protein